MFTYFYIFLSIFIVSLVSFVGVFTLSVKEPKMKKLLPLLVSLSVGTLLGGFFIHILPELVTESAENFSTISIFILTGILFFYLTEKIVHWHHHHTASAFAHCKDCHQHHIKPVGYMILFTDAFHNFLDGIMIASAFLLDIHLGFITTILVIMHEIPQEIGDFGILIHSGFTKARALWLNFLSALTALLGGLTVIFSLNFINNISVYLTAIAGGGFLYIAMVDLMPELHQHKHTRKTIGIELFFVLLGIILMFLLLIVEKVL